MHKRRTTTNAKYASGYSLMLRHSLCWDVATLSTRSAFLNGLKLSQAVHFARETSVTTSAEQLN